MKASLSSTVLTTVLLATAGCSSDPIELQPDRNEVYDREFVKEFGAPVTDHDFSLATTAGLTVTSSSGKHVTVTASIDGKSYLFADCSVPAGTTALPVTIPNTVTRLKITTSDGDYFSDPNGNINLDKSPDSTRSRKIAEASENSNGYLNIRKTDNWENHGPLLVFKVGDFLYNYISKNPIGEDNTDYSYSYINDQKTVKHPGCSLFGITNDSPYESITYYVFPLWWRSNRYGYKRYDIFSECYPFSPEVNSYIDELFASNKSSSKGIYFPQLGHIDNPSIRATSVTEWDFSQKFTFDKGTDTKAYDINNGNTLVATRGIKITVNKPTKNAFNMFTLSLTGRKDSKNNYTSSTYPGGDSSGNGFYYDVPIDNLFLATTSTKETRLDKMDYNILELDNYSESNSDIYTKTPERKYRDACIIGFSTPPNKANDSYPRDYADVILLVIMESNAEERAWIYGSREEPYEWTIAAEDLGGSHDWDFNDAVFKFTDVIYDLNSANDNWKSSVLSGPYNTPRCRKYEITPIAAGGTMPIYITYEGKVLPEGSFPSSGQEMYSDFVGRYNELLNSTPEGTYIIGTELHKWLGASTHTSALNVGSNRNQALKGKTITLTVSPYASSTSSRATKPSGSNETLRGFSILVDRENKLQIDTRDGDGFVHMPELTLGKDTYLISAPSEDKGQIAPQLILLDNDWEWPQEGVNIGDAYPSFRNWITTGSWNEWTTTNVDTSKITSK